jgi:aminoglycoside phosphotransferase (APT) family kinase protein
MSWPAAELNIDAALVTALLHTQYPHFDGFDCYECGEGFDNSLWRLGPKLVVRLPRREAAVTPLRNELLWLGQVAGHVSLQTPLPLLPGAPSGDFPWPWSISTWIDGVPGDEVDINERGRSAPSMAIFLRQVHVDAPPDAPRNPYRSVPLTERSATFEERLDEVRDVLDHEKTLALWLKYRDVPIGDGPARWLHGDFHPGNTLYRDGELVGVVDFGDLCAGDPATDLAGGLMSLPYDALDEFFRAYGLVDGAMFQRTIGWAVFFGVMMVSLGLHDRPSYLRAGQNALSNATRLADGR